MYLCFSKIPKCMFSIIRYCRSHWIFQTDDFFYIFQIPSLRAVWRPPFCYNFDLYNLLKNALLSNIVEWNGACSHLMSLLTCLDGVHETHRKGERLLQWSFSTTSCLVRIENNNKRREKEAMILYLKIDQREVVYITVGACINSITWTWKVGFDISEVSLLYLLKW